MKKSELKFEHFKEDIVHSVEYISWEKLEEKMGKRMYKKFMKFMMGQTCIENGAFPRDVNNFFKAENKRFFD